MRNRRWFWWLCGLFPGVLVALCAGCGGADFGGLQQNLSGDIAPGYNTPIAMQNRNTSARLLPGQGCYPMIETSFQLAKVPGDPFDFEKVNVQVVFQRPDGGTVSVPAFYDGDQTWRARYTPIAPGRYVVQKVLLNGQIAHETNLNPTQWNVSGTPEPGFIRINPADTTRFVFDNGNTYYPVGNNEAWPSPNLPDIPALFAKMHVAGENWSRVWMTHWANQNLDWVPGKKIAPGDIDLDVARRWDKIVEAAQQNGIYFQMVLQHHGQYSSNVNPNWNENPYNVKNGGFLQAPDDFFTNPQAIEATKRKLYYILARWGYSPNIMAFELFNEVQFTDAYQHKHDAAIAQWHREMADFLRRYDINHHLITTSSAPDVPYDSPIWQSMDYIQVHSYPPDPLTTLAAGPPAQALKLNKPIFVGEFGPATLDDPNGVALHNGLWAGLMRWPSGSPEYWSWDVIEQHDLYGNYAAATAFLNASELPEQRGLQSLTLSVETQQHADLVLAPGGGFEPAKQSTFTISPEGAPPAFGTYPSFLQGQFHRDMMPEPLALQVNCAEPIKGEVQVDRVAKAGAVIQIGVDGQVVVTRKFDAADSDYTPDKEQGTLAFDLPAGQHTLTLQNTGSDWVQIRRIVLRNYALALQCLARVGKDYVAGWVYNRSGIYAPADAQPEPADGRLTLPALTPGTYRLVWWDTHAGKALSETRLTVGGTEKMTIAIPPIARDVAFYVIALHNEARKAK
ncbi:MAG TPA: DUF5060 domain-containing protein [Chthonomonas sp.]|uniref:DUF5060 domain-containing protein n=1 Tax=Chthonomonas sp. TaxID=2282153 RepID=UPI002B4B7B29|nr:DUF5060 domain-containing protein [Chthonomonas sp.]HLH81567.1 DUF5060 domain-containing protein [Chthonomonas sp.]